MIYELWLMKNHQAANVAMANITQEDRKAFDETFNDAAMEKAGSGWFLYCWSAWANEEYKNWGITTYKSIADRIAHVQVIEKVGWFRYANMYSLMGVLANEEEPPAKPDFPNPIYQLWIMKANPVALANYTHLSKEEEKELWAKWNESVARTGACMVLSCKSGWCDESAPRFGVVAFPSIEARIAHVDDLEKLNWGLYIDAFTLLGTPI